jgi:hypothetical protein
VKRVLTGRRGVVVAVLVVVGVLLALGDRADQLACGFDPTDDCNWSVFVVRNDTAHPVVLRQCMHHCGRGDRRLSPIDVPAGTSSPPRQYGAVYALTDDLAWWEVTDAPGRTRRGCLVLDGHSDKRDGDVVLVSQAQSCRASQPPTKRVGRVRVQSP